MPNWCSNSLIVEGKPKELHKFLKHIELTESEAKALGHDEGTKFSCHRVIPQPVFQGDEWYDWRIANWGSKWDLTDLDFFQEDWESGMVGCNFNTAWSPILPVIEELATQYPTLEFQYQYYEGGSDYWGKHLIHNAKKINEIDGGELSSASCEIRMELEGNAHHWCDQCGDTFDCSEENTPSLCEACSEEIDTLDKDLWDTSIEDKDKESAELATVI